jgi:cytochrome c553
MSTFLFKVITGLILVGAVSVQTWAAQNSAITPELIHIQRCSACHYIDGKPPSEEFPHIAGQYEQYLLKALKLFKEGQRENEAMELITSLHREQELVILANYYAKQKPADDPANITPDQPLVQRGAQLFASARVYGISCADCHGPDAKGYVRSSPRTRVSRAIPRLSGQQPPYIKAKLMKYTGAETGKPSAGMCGMRKAGKTLSPNDVDALVEFLSSK